MACTALAPEERGRLKGAVTCMIRIFNSMSITTGEKDKRLAGHYCMSRATSLMFHEDPT